MKAYLAGSAIALVALQFFSFRDVAMMTVGAILTWVVWGISLLGDEPRGADTLLDAPEVPRA